MKDKLTTLDWRIYNFIKQQSENDFWTSQDDIQQHLLYDAENNQVYVDKRTIRFSIQRIRDCDTIQKIILTDYKKGYKLMSVDDSTDYFERKKIHILSQLKRLYHDVRRYNHNGQCKIVFDSKERDFIESLVDKQEDDENDDR